MFISLPTGYGKSICFALLPLVFDRMRGDVGSIVMCISPLTALMMEQRTKFSVRGISSEYICLQQDIEAMDRVRKGMVQLLYVSPESILSNPQWRDMLLLPVYQKNIVALESAINYRPPSIIGRARALTLAATNKLIIAKDRWVNVG